MTVLGTDPVTDLLAELARHGIKIRLADGGRIAVSAPRGRLSADLADRLSCHKAELTAWLRDSMDGDPAVLPTIVPDTEHLHDPFPPSDLQQSFLIGSREGFEFHVRPHQYMEFDLDELDPARFEAALNTVLRRHRRSLVVVRDDMLLQTVRDPQPVRVTVSDLRSLPVPQAEEQMASRRAAMRRQEPRHDRWPWFSPHISLYGAGRARLHYNNNNLFTDAPSGTALITEALHRYRHPGAPAPELTLSYRDCVLALAELENSALGEGSRKYWCDRMADWPDAPALPLVPGTEHRGRSRMTRRELMLPAPLWHALRARADALGLSRSTVLLSAYAEAIAYWSGSRHFLLNNMISHRPVPLHPQMAEVLGNFASLYPLEVDWRPDEPFTDRVRRLQARVLADVAHSYWSGAKVLQTLNQVRRTPGRASCPFAVGSALFVGPVDRPYYGMLETPQTLLDTEFWELRDGRLLVIWDVIEAMFPDGLIDAMFAGYRSVLAALADDDHAWRRTAFDLLPTAQRQQRDRLNRSEPPLPACLLSDSLPKQAADRPDAAAVVAAGTAVSYAELARRSSDLAVLLRRRGTAPGDRIAVVLSKGAHQVLAVHAVLAAGGAYVPIDPGWPTERIGYLLADTAATAVLTDAAGQRRLAELTDVPVLDVDQPAEPARHPVGAGRQPGDLAYVIYTSGSTGRPKGVMLDHRGPLNTILDINRRFDVGPDDVLFGVSSLCFDLSVYDVFGSAAAGATLVQPVGAGADPAAWLDLVGRHRVTVWNSVPAIMQLFAAEAASAGARFPALRLVLLSGDWIPVKLPDQIRQVAPNARVVSLGGATEASIWSICYPIDAVDPAWPSIPYGRPLAGQSWHVLDETGRDAPTWVPGELYIGGAGLALGYLGDPAKTAAAFVTHPRTGARLYRTGDLGRYLPSGDVEFLGRADFQVKIQGFRVEPGEVEAALTEHSQVGEAAVVARPSGSGWQLAGFVTAGAGLSPPDPARLRTFLAGKLPGYLIPDAITVLDRLPLTGNGKLDRSALRARPTGGLEHASTPAPPTTPTEAALLDIWTSVLGSGPVGVHDDFFDLGGQSFAALRMTGLIAERLGHRVSLGVVLERRTVADLAAWLDAADRDWSPLVRLRADGTGTPWFLVHPAGGQVACYRALAQALPGPVYAFQAPGPETGQQPLERVEELADRYLEALTGCRPAGPYLLGGWSSGGVIAFELARRLEQRGEDVAGLALIDAPAPVAEREVPDVTALLWFLEDLNIGFDAAAVTQADRVRLAGLPEPDQWAAALSLVPADRFDATALAATFAVFRGVVRACNRYQPSAVNAGLTVIRAGRDVVSEFAGHPAGGAADWGWPPLTTGTVRATAVTGTHHSLLADDDSIAIIAELMASASL